MKHQKKHISHSGVALFSCGLVLTIVTVACSRDGLSKGALSEQINASLEKDGPVCWPLNQQRAADVKFPFFEKTLPAFAGGLDPIIAGLVEGGYLSATPHRQTFGSGSLYDLTAKGKDAKVWDPEHGFCVGTKELDEVVDWTVPGEGGQQATRINYTWKVSKRPSWVDDELFSRVPGIPKSEAGFAIAQKTNKGWKVVF